MLCYLFYGNVVCVCVCVCVRALHGFKLLSCGSGWVQVVLLIGLYLKKYAHRFFSLNVTGKGFSN